MKAPPFKPPPFRVDFSDVILAMTVLKGLNDVEIKKHVLSIKDVHRQTTMDIVGLIEAQEQGRDGPGCTPYCRPSIGRRGDCKAREPAADLPVTAAALRRKPRRCGRTSRQKSAGASDRHGQ